MEEGKISQCPHNGCNYTCCTFNQSNYIVMYPGEFEEARQRGESLSHLVITDENYHGGKKAVCKAVHGQTCDNGYKPLDCQSYPLFPALENEDLSFIRGIKCPLINSDLIGHSLFVKNKWQVLMDVNNDVKIWLSKVTLVGYEKLKLKSQEERTEPEVAKSL
ncbi:MAG TPA: hypothetical protein VEB42_03330 [Chitinophagaceae bacterium]|nr:hypothetical protein [Chitinophagaceae bacterium]